MTTERPLETPRLSESNLHQQHSQDSNDAKTGSGTWQYIRLLLHLVAATQFMYGFSYWFQLHVPNSREAATVALSEEEEARMRWGGKFRYLTFLNLLVQTIYHTIALLNDLFGHDMPLRRIRDYIFAILAFPLTLNVCLSFWFIYAIDRELIFPKALDAFFPNWLNHLVHTNILLFMLLDLATCCRAYPRRRTGLMCITVFMVLYIVWIHIVRYYSGQWAYPLFDILNIYLRYVLLGTLLAFTLCCYVVGELLNATWWSLELKKLKTK